MPNTPPSAQTTAENGLGREGGVQPESGRRADAEVSDGGADVTTVDATTNDAEASHQVATEACPEGMQLVDTDYCPRIERRCIDEEYSPQNHITICHKFAKTQRCLVPQEHRRFCIDTYEYPNREGAHPPWMVSWYDAQATCASLGKRTCYESEWVAACEGPAKTPFPYGHTRDNAKCNIDNQWISPNLGNLYRSDEQTKLRELSRLDQKCTLGRHDRVRQRLWRTRHDRQLRRMGHRRRAARRQVGMGRAEGRRMGTRAQCLSPGDHQPPARLHLLLHQLPLLRRRGRRRALHAQGEHGQTQRDG